MRLTLHPDTTFSLLAHLGGEWAVVERAHDGGMALTHEHERHLPITFVHDEDLHQLVMPAHVRARRGAQPSAANTQCGVFLDADERFYAQWAGPCLPADTAAACSARQLQRVLVSMIDILHRADGIYDMNFHGAVRLGLAGAAVQTSNNLGIPTPTGNNTVSENTVLARYQNWLAAGATAGGSSFVTQAVRGAGLPSSQHVCLNYLLTHINCGDVLGVANLASPAPNVAGGICDTYIFSTGGAAPFRAVNTGFTTTLSQFGVVPHLQSVLVLSHEVGHNFGSPHDCSTDCALGDLPCVPSDANGGTFIMYPSITNNLGATNAAKFSPCSISNMTLLYQAKGSCLQVPNPCANQTGECCAGTTPLPSTTVCRPPDFALPCDDSAYCFGDYYCPGNNAKPDGAYCNLNFTLAVPGASGVCFETQCRNLNSEFCAASEGGLAPCSIPGSECVRACIARGQCVAVASGCNTGIFFSTGPCLYAAAGTPCNTAAGLDGTCSGAAACVPCGKIGCNFTASASSSTKTPASTTTATTKKSASTSTSTSTTTPFPTTTLLQTGFMQAVVVLTSGVQGTVLFQQPVHAFHVVARASLPCSL